MTDKHTHQAPADAQTPFFLYQQTFNTEAKKVLDETTRTMEKSFGEWEKNMAEMNRLFMAQSRYVMDQQKAFLDAVMTGARSLVK